MALFKPHDRIGDLEVLAALPSGGQAELYRAVTHLDSPRFPKGKHYVVKAVSSPDNMVMVRDEARHLSQLQVEQLHPHVVHLVDWRDGEVHPRVQWSEHMEARSGGDILCIAFEYLPGQSLKFQVGLSLREIAQMGVELLLALSFIHSRQVIHLDVKPDNVLFRPRRRSTRLQSSLGLFTQDAVLIDFGIARNVDDTVLISKGMVSEEYASPEQFLEADYRDQVPSDKRCRPASDLFSWGVLMYEQMTRANPHTVNGRFDHRLKLDPAFVPRSIRALNRRVPEALDSVILRCLKYDPRQRFGSANEAMAALEAAIPRLPATSPRHLARAALAATGLSVVGCGAVMAGAILLLAPQVGQTSATPTASSVTSNGTTASPTVSATERITPTLTATIKPSPTTPTQKPVPTKTPTATPRPPTRTPAPAGTAPSPPP